MTSLARDALNGVESGLVVPVPIATPVVSPWRERLDPSAVHGVPAHVTVLYPFLPPPDLSHEVIVRLARLFASREAFRFSLESVGWFGDEVVYLAPSPPESFIELTLAVMDDFPGYAPYAGTFDEIVPHLTVGDRGDVAELRQAADSVAAHLPIAARATEVWMMVGAAARGRWTVHSRFPLGGRAAD